MGKAKRDVLDPDAPLPAVSDTPATFEVPALMPRRSTAAATPLVRFEAILGAGYHTADKAGNPVLKLTLIDPGAEWFLYALREKAAERLMVEVFAHDDDETTFGAVLAELMGDGDADVKQ